MGETRNVKVKWTVDTQQAVRATDRYNKTVKDTGRSLKDTSKSQEQFRSELGSQINTLVGVGAAFQFGISVLQAYRQITQEAAQATLNAALANEHLSGRINQVAESARLAKQALQASLVAGGADVAAQAEQLAEAALVRQGRLGRVRAAIRRLPLIGQVTGALEALIGTTEGREQQAQGLGRDPAQIRGRFVQRAEEERTKITDARARKRFDTAFLAELQKQTFSLEAPRQAAEQQ